MPLGSEFTFHPSIDKPGERTVGMFRLELKDGKSWMPMARMLTTEKVEAEMSRRGRKKGVHYRFVDLNKAVRTRKAAKPVGESAE